MFRLLPPLRSLKAFESAGRHVSFAKAADELAVTPAAISQQIKILEDWAGQPLFHREHPLRLTPIAFSVLPMLSDAFYRLSQAAGRLKISQSSKSLIVSTSSGFASKWLLPRLEKFQTLYPSVEVRISATTRVIDFETEDVDVAIRFGAGKYQGLFSERLRAEEVVPVAAPRLAQKLKAPEDLLDVTLLRNDGVLWDPSFPDWVSWLHSVGLDPNKATIRTYGDEVGLIIEAALAGLGVGLIWRTLIADELADGRLMAVFPSRALNNAYHFVCPPRNLDTYAVAAFREWIKAEMEINNA